MDPKLFFSDPYPDPTFQEISGPYLPVNFFCPYCTVKLTKTTTNFMLIRPPENWSLSDPDPKLIIPDPDPGNNFGFGSTTMQIGTVIIYFENFIIVGIFILSKCWFNVETSK